MLHDSLELMAKVIRDAKLPAGSSYRDTATLLGFISDEQRTRVVPELLEVQGRYLVARKEVALTAGKDRIRLPSRQIRVERVQLLTQAGIEVRGFTKASAGQADSLLGSTLANSTPGLWYFEDDEIVLRPPPDGAGWKLVVSYRRWPNRLITTASCWKVKTVYPGSEGVELEAVNGGEAPGSPSEGARYDIIKGVPSFSSLRDDEVFSTIDYPDVGLSSALVDVEVGDLIAPAGYTCVAQLPLAYHDLLVQVSVARVCRELADMEGRAAAKEDANELRGTIRSTLAPRVEEPDVIVADDWP